jgi:hypothetical protein
LFQNLLGFSDTLTEKLPSAFRYRVGGVCAARALRVGGMAFAKATRAVTDWGFAATQRFRILRCAFQSSSVA